MFNTISIEGRLLRDPEIKRLPSGLAIATVTVACERSIKKEGKPSLFIPCNLYGAQAENVAKWFKKGDAIIVTGRLENDKFESKDAPGETKTIYYIDGKSFDFPVGKEKKAKAQASEPTGMVPLADDEPDVIADDLPF